MNEWEKFWLLFHTDFYVLIFFFFCVIVSWMSESQKKTRSDTMRHNKREWIMCVSLRISDPFNGLKWKIYSASNRKLQTIFHHNFPFYFICVAASCFISFNLHSQKPSQNELIVQYLSHWKFMNRIWFHITLSHTFYYILIYGMRWRWMFDFLRIFVNFCHIQLGVHYMKR